jgi:hypothetical protein
VVVFGRSEDAGLFLVMMDASQVGDHPRYLLVRASLAECNAATVFGIEDGRGLIGNM